MKNSRVAVSFIVGLVAIGLAFGYVKRRSAQRELERSAAVAPAPAPAPAPAASPANTDMEPSASPKARDANIYRMEGAVEQLRGFARTANMSPAETWAYRVLPPNLEGAGKTIEAADVLESYVNAEHDRWLIIMKPGDHAYAVNASETASN